MNQKYLWYVVGIVVIVLIIVGVRRQGAGSPSASASPSPSSEVSGSPTAKPTVKRTPTPAPAGSSMPQSYSDAVKAHEGRRLQFDARCQVSITKIVVKNGQTIMLDNRSGDPRTVVVGSTQYQLAGYGWRIVTMSSKTLPATVVVDCGAAQNVAQIVIEK